MASTDAHTSNEAHGGQPAPMRRRQGMHLFKRKTTTHQDESADENANGGQEQDKLEKGQGNLQHDSVGRPKRVTPGIQPDGESGRSWFHPWHFLRICFRSSSHMSKWTNLLWPFTIAAMVLFWQYGHHIAAKEVSPFSLWVFITAYIGMVPAANLVGFAGQELARKIPKVAGVILETTFGSLVEIILFMILVSKGPLYVPVIQAAILGSILANLLLCLGMCFLVGGVFHPQQVFHEAISEVGSNLMLVAGLGLIIPTVFYNTLIGNVNNTDPQAPAITAALLEARTLKISYATAIVLLIAFLVYLWFQAGSHHGLFEEILEADEERDHDRHQDLAKAKLTLTESIVALVIALTFVSFMAYFLVQEIEYLVLHRGVSDHFLGLILVPLVEKASEHLTAIDEAYDNQMNFALAHVLGASIQTALLNTPLVVLVGWGIGTPMSLNFELFDAVILILAIIVIGNFLRDEKSDYLEGALSVFVYVLVAVTAFYYPNPARIQEEIHHLAAEAAASEGGGHVAKMMMGL